MIKVENWVQFHNRKRRTIFHIFSASNVRSTITMLDIVVVWRRENTKHQLFILMKILHVRSQGMMIIKEVWKIVEMSSSSSTLHVEMMWLSLVMYDDSYCDGLPTRRWRLEDSHDSYKEVVGSHPQNNKI